MISNKKAILGGVVLAIVTAILTSTVQIVMGNKVVISKDLYEEYKKHNDLIALEELVETGFYQDVDEEVLIESAIKGMFNGLNDPYSLYYTEEEFKELLEQTSGSFVGIGVYINAAPDDEYITVISPIEGSPAEKAGIMPGDKIIKVDDKVVSSKDSDGAVAMIKGEEGTEVKVTIKRGIETKDIVVKRETIVTETVEYTSVEDEIGYIQITSFSEHTLKEFEGALEKAKDDKGLIIDLRNNPGGLLDVCAEIADLLVGEGTIVYTKDNQGNTEYLKSDAKKIGIPIAVLTNEGSASASEILTAAIVDNKAGISVGTTTFGKGLVQTVRELTNGTGFKLTTAQYFTPKDEYINGKGIEPTIKEENVEKQIEVALEWLKEKIK